MSVKQSLPVSSSLQPPGAYILLSVSVNLPLLGSLLSEILQYLCVCVWPLSLSLRLSRFAYTGAGFSASFLFMAVTPHRTDSPLMGLLGRFRLVVTVNVASVKLRVQGLV